MERNILSLKRNAKSGKVGSKVYHPDKIKTNTLSKTKIHALSKKDLKNIENEVIQLAHPEIERILAHSLRKVLENYDYPPEECIKPSFVKKVMKARLGNGKDFSNLKALEEYLS